MKPSDTEKNRQRKQTKEYVKETWQNFKNLVGLTPKKIVLSDEELEEQAKKKKEELEQQKIAKGLTAHTGFNPRDPKNINKDSIPINKKDLPVVVTPVPTKAENLLRTKPGVPINDPHITLNYSSAVGNENVVESLSFNLKGKIMRLDPDQYRELAGMVQNLQVNVLDITQPEEKKPEDAINEDHTHEVKFTPVASTDAPIHRMN